jgi:hypothetical protein
LTKVSKGIADSLLHKTGKVSQVTLDKVNAVQNEIEYPPNLIA